jgi:lipid-binding SYLF domain-containing protein
MVLLAALGVLLPLRAAQAGPNQTVRDADSVLREVMAVPVRQIPARLLSEAEGIAIIPNVIKIGFIGALRLRN